ncbi:MAG: GGDEF domain-containing protein [Anaerolineaceae bacterium]|nr:GGDEF domain-containing protein [Anaerolineaceae bacterium]
MNPYETLLQVMNYISDGVYFVDLDRKITYWNEAASKITGYSAAEVMDRPCFDDGMGHISEDGTHLCGASCPLKLTLHSGDIQNNRIYLLHKEGHRVPVWVKVVPLKDEAGKIVGAFQVFNREVEKQAISTELIELRQKVETDALTGVKSRGYLESRLETILLEKRLLNYSFALLFIDIDHFKTINDEYGHVEGDRVLKMVANTLVENTREEDIVGRWGGDEFLAILKSPGSRSEVQLIAEKLRILLENSILSSNLDRVKISVSIGGAFPTTNDTVEAIIERADRLMYQSKHTGRNRITLQAEN